MQIQSKSFPRVKYLINTSKYINDFINKNKSNILSQHLSSTKQKEK